jgi:PAS domain S-box-containing protein
MAQGLTLSYNWVCIEEAIGTTYGFQEMVHDGNAKATILVVDDIPDTVQLMKDWLESHNFRTLGVTSSVKALELAEQETPDLILMDVMMPKMDGMETCRRLKANPKTAGIPVIIVTAKNPSDARAEGMMAGAVDYIAKPVNLNDLVKRIETALATTSQAPMDVQRLLEEVVHSALTILSIDMVWLLGVDNEEAVLKSRILATTGGARVETDFLIAAADGQATPKFSLHDENNPLCATLQTRSMLTNVGTESLKENPATQSLFHATEMLRLNYLTVVPLTVGGKTPGVMVLGKVQPLNVEDPRTRQILISLGSQAAIALDYSRLITNLTQSETEMRREQVFRQMILDTMSDGLVVIDAKGTIKYINRRLLRMTNYSKGYLEGQSVGELFHPDDRVEVLVGLLREGAATMKFDQRLVTREGKIIPVWLTRSRAQSDDLDNQVIVLTDMTDQKQREEELEMQTSRLTGLNEELERQTGRLTALNRAAHVITSNLSLHQTLNNILESAMRVVEAQGASLFLFNKENPAELLAVAAVGSGSDVMHGMRVPVGEGVAGWVAREAKSQLVGDISHDERFYRGVDERTGMHTQSLIAVPLINADSVIGVVEVVNKLNDRFFDEDDVKLLEGMAGTAGVSIVNARLFEETKRRVSELGTLLNVSATASSTLQFSEVLEGIARNIAERLGVARCSILAWNGSRNRLESLAEICDTTWVVNTAPVQTLSYEPLARAVLTSGSTVRASLLDADISAENRTVLGGAGMVSMMLTPISLNGSVCGLATVFSADAKAGYNDESIEQIQVIVQDWQQGLNGVNALRDAERAVLNGLVDELMTIDSTCWVTIRIWNAGDDFVLPLREKGFAEWTKRSGAALPIENYPTLQGVIQNKALEMVTLDNLTDDAAEREWLTHRGGLVCMMIPLIERGLTVGALKLVNQEGRLFDDDEVRLAQGIANVVGNAMENARLYQSLDIRAKALESAYKELQEADKAKDEFIQNVSHELRTPLISVLGYAGLLEEGSLGEVNDQQSEALTMIVQKAQKLADLVEDIVSVQALENRTFERKPIDLVEITRGVIEKFESQAAASGIRLNIRLPENLPPVLADVSTIGDALEKLLDNAIKFGKNGEVVDVVLQDTDGAVVQVMVRDYGIGIDPSEHQKIFRRFYQVDGGVNRHYPGTGLGLAIVKAIVEGHGGRIGVKSKLNEGATFVFTLPKYTTLVQA